MISNFIQHFTSDYLSKLRFKLVHVSKTDHSSHSRFFISVRYNSYEDCERHTTSHNLYILFIIFVFCYCLYRSILLLSCMVVHWHWRNLRNNPLITPASMRVAMENRGNNGPLTRYVKLQVAHAPGMPGTFSPAADFKGNRKLAIPTCITARAWRTCRDACRDRALAVTGKTFPAFPAHAHLQFCVSGKRPIKKE